MKEAKNKQVEHGEVWLQPVRKLPKGKTETLKSFIVAHSETGHHHVLESDTGFEVMTVGEKKELYLRLFEPGKIVHQKQVDKHKTLPVYPGIYKVINKQQYDPFAAVMKDVID